MPEPQYVVLDVAPILKNVPASQKAQVLADTIKNTTWYNFEDSRINPPAMKRLVSKLEKTNRNSFPKVWAEIKDYADSHNIWINEE